MGDKQLSILVLDDDPVIRNLLKSILRSRTRVVTAGTPSAAFNCLKEEAFDIMITDFRLPEQDGISVLKNVKLNYPEVEVIMISSEGDMDTVIRAMREGAVDYFKKPFTASDIWISIERTQKFSELHVDIQNYKARNEKLRSIINNKSGQEIIGKSSATRSVLHQMHQVAKTHDTSVLILGESGTGKELVARGIHEFSSRKNEIFGAVNMSAIPDTLFESEFFGHKKGSFTGAIGDKAGWFEMADQGTMFFDEIGEMDISQQVKLLRVLEDRKFNKIGSQKEQQFDIRIISATNKSVDEMSSGKSFRSDLYYRLSTFIIQVSPLRERSEDIPLLMDHFLETFSRKMMKRFDGFHPDTYRILQSHPFPGNIRELRNIIERAVILSTGKLITPVQLPDFISKTGFSPSDGVPNGDEILDLQELERRTILRALQKSHYNKNEAAKLLNLQWNALYRRMQKHGISDQVTDST